jgi:Chaperone of endosialidase
MSPPCPLEYKHQETRDGQTVMPSVMAGSLQAVNSKFTYITSCEEGTIEKINSYRVTGLLLPTEDCDAANKEYVDSQTQHAGGSDTNVQYNSGGVLAGSNNFTWNNGTKVITLNNGTLRGLVAPTTVSDAANKGYVDAIAVGFSPAPPVNSIQFNAGSSAFGGSSNLQWVTATNTLAVSGFITNGSLSINSVGNLSTGGIITCTNTTQSTNTTSGSVILSGGVGIAKDVHIGGMAYATKFIATSDALLKDNIVLADNTLDKLRYVECYSYNLKRKENSQGIRTKKPVTEYGFLAQQLEQIGLGNLVDNTRKFKGVNYLPFIAMLVSSVKELDKRLVDYSMKKNGLNPIDITKQLSDSLDSLKVQKVTEIKQDITSTLSTVVSKTLDTIEINVKDTFLEFSKDINAKFYNINIEVDNIYDNLEHIKAKNVETFEDFSHSNKKITDAIDDINCKLNTIDTRISDLKENADSIVERMLETFTERLEERIKMYEKDIIRKYNDGRKEEIGRKMSRKR